MTAAGRRRGVVGLLAGTGLSLAAALATAAWDAFSAPPRLPSHAHQCGSCGEGDAVRVDRAIGADRATAGHDSVIAVRVADGVEGLARAIGTVRRHGRVIVQAGTYTITEPLRVSRPMHIEGAGDAVLDAGGRGSILLVEADSVTVSGLTLRNTGISYVEDRAAIRFTGSTACRVTASRIEDAYFGIYLSQSNGCEIMGNELRAHGTDEGSSGNGIHLWSSRDARIAGNRVSGFRDGIYFEFVHHAEVRENVSERNIRYGLHFMYSDDSRYSDNVFRRNGSGVAVMFTRRVGMQGNRFESNWGAAAYGLLLKEITDSRLDHNVFSGNTVALQADGASRLVATGNEFRDNGWAVRLGANTDDARFSRNAFERNTFDVAASGGTHTTVFAGNYWDSYRGYDLNRNGIGDIPHPPVRLFSLVVQGEQPSLILLRSGFVSLLDAAERAIPSLTPRALSDRSPRMRRGA